MFCIHEFHGPGDRCDLCGKYVPEFGYVPEFDEGSDDTATSGHSDAHTPDDRTNR